ncbi:MAG: galactokinase family protein [bacterium]|nr:galactokinase family protein [bacterium]
MQVQEWINKISQFDAAVKKRCEQMYGDAPELLADRQQAYLNLLTAFGNQFGYNRELVISRSPSRVNLKGVHIEHRGGFVNYLTHRREILIAASPRNDDGVVLYNLRSNLFPAREFSIQDELNKGNWKDWWEYIAADEVVKTVSEYQGDWMNYVKAAILRLQSRFPSKPFKGMDLYVNGDIPLAAGLSSSSALVVATAYAGLAINKLEIDKFAFVELCGQAEWYVGTRGGAGDHAAMILGKRSHLAHIQFFPLQVHYYSFPKGYRVVICNSMKEASKSKEVKNIFNSRVVGYELGFLLIKKQFPHYASELQHLRDVNTTQLAVPETEIYRILKSLPEKISRAEAHSLLPNNKEHLVQLFNSHDEPEEGYWLRDLCLFGLAECERGKICVDFLVKKDIKGFGKLMELSHHGDRVVAYDEKNNQIPWNNHIAIAQLDELIADLESNDETRVNRAYLYLQPGGYRCSCEMLDLLVDTANRVPGVVGAGLTGAGLGGCILVLVDEKQVDQLLTTMQKEYYTPRQLSLGAEVCVSVSGAGIVSL